MSNSPHVGLADLLTAVPIGSSVGGTPNPGGGSTPIVAGVPAFNVGLYCAVACTANVVFRNGATITALPFVAGWHPLELRSVGNASVANALYWATQSQLLCRALPSRAALRPRAFSARGR